MVPPEPLKNIPFQWAEDGPPPSWFRKGPWSREIPDAHFWTWSWATRDLFLDGTRWEALPALGPREEVVPYKRRVPEVPLIQERYGVKDDNFFSTMNRTDGRATKYLKEKLGVVLNIVFGKRELAPLKRVLTPKNNSPGGGFEKAKPKQVPNNRHFRPEHPRWRNPELFENLWVLIADIRWKTRGIFYSELSESDTKTKGRRILPFTKPDPEVEVVAPEGKIVRQQSGPPVSLPFGLRASPKLWEPVVTHLSENRVKTRRPGKKLARRMRRRVLPAPTPSPDHVSPDKSPVLPETGSGGSESGGSQEGAKRGSKKQRTDPQSNLPEIPGGEDDGKVDMEDDGMEDTNANLERLSREVAVPSPDYQITFDWLNDAETELRASVVEECDFPGGPAHPPFVGKWCKVRVVAKLNEDDSERTDGYVMLLKKFVQILAEDSPRPNRISVTLLKACDGTCVSLPDPTTWGGGVWCTSGSAVAFDTDSAGTTERVLTVPYKSATPQTIYPVR